MGLKQWVKSEPVIMNYLDISNMGLDTLSRSD